MYTYLKKNLFCLLIILLSFITTASKAAEDDEHENKHRISVTLKAEAEDATDKPSLKKQLSSQVMPLEETKASWTSCLMAPVKIAAYTAYDVLQYTVQNPKKSVFIGLILASQAVTAFDCNCLCYNVQNPTEKVYVGYLTPPQCNLACFKLNGAWEPDHQLQCN